MKTLSALFIGLSVLAMSGCNHKAAAGADRAKAKTVVDEMTKAIETEDMDLLSKITAHDADMVTLGTDAGER